MQYKFTETDYIDQQKSLNLELQKDYPFCCNKKWCPNGCGKKVTKVKSVFTYQKNLWKRTKCERYFLRTRETPPPTFPMEHTHGINTEDRAGISTSPIGHIPQTQGSLGNEKSEPLSPIVAQLKN